MEPVRRLLVALLIAAMALLGAGCRGGADVNVGGGGEGGEGEGGVEGEVEGEVGGEGEGDG